MAKVVRIYETGGPDVLRFEDAHVGEPGPGEVRLRHLAVGLNFADTYFRSGIYEIPLPSGIGNEAAGVIEAVGAGVTHLAVGDRVTYTGFTPTLGAYSTERLISAAPLIKLPEAISCEVAAAMTMRGLSAAYLLRRIWPLKAGDTVLLHAAAGGGRSDHFAMGQTAGADCDWNGFYRGQGRSGACPWLRPHDQLQP